MLLFKALTIISLSFVFNINVYACSTGSEPSNGTPPFIDPDYVHDYGSDERGIYSSSPYDKLKILLSEYIDDSYVPKSELEQKIEECSNHHQQMQIFISKADKMLATKGIKYFESQFKSKNLHQSNYYNCNINDKTAALIAFLEAVFKDKSISDEYLRIAKTRLEIFDTDFQSREELQKITNQIERDINDIKNVKAWGYRQYLQALVHFYSKDYDKASLIFEDLSGRDNISPWISETSLYMLARSYLTASQKNWDGFSNLRNIDKNLLKKAETTYRSYINQYPKGLYVKSSWNIERRIAFLQGEEKRLNKLLKLNIARSFNDLNDSKSIYNALIEFNNYSTGSDIDISTDHPIIIAQHILSSNQESKNTLEQLENNKKRFNKYPNLYQYIAALDLPLKDKPTFIGSKIIQAKSLAKLNKKQEAILAWQQIVSTSNNYFTQLGLASEYANQGKLESLFKDQLVSNSNILAYLIELSANTQEIEKLLNKNIPKPSIKIIVDELLRRYLLTGSFKSMVILYGKYNTSKEYQEIRKSVERLAINQEDADSYLEIAKFINKNIDKSNPYINNKGYNSYNEIEAVDKRQIKSFCKKCDFYLETIIYNSKLKQKTFSPYQYFLKSFDIYQKNKITNEKEAEVLHNLTECFKGFDVKYGCQFNSDNANESKKFFNILHKKYPKSKWTKATPYYF